jgi:cytochrome c-type biogenesis protein CcmE
VVALSIAGILAVFLIYTALAGSTPALQPSNLAGHAGTVSLTGKVVTCCSGDSHVASEGLHFEIHNINGASPTIPIVYHGSVPDLFEKGRDVNVTGKLVNGAFVATALTTKCPSKYTAKA